MTFKPRTKIAIAVLLSVFMILSATGLVAANALPTLDYVALGDSLAAGQKPTAFGTDPGDYKFGIGYPQMVRNFLADQGILGSYENFGDSGKTTDILLADLSEDEALQLAVAGSEIVTIDVGADDILPALIAYGADGISDEEAAILYEQSGGVITRICQIVLTIKSMNPACQIYVMGYYNAFPFIDPLLQSQVVPLITNFNTQLKLALQAVSAGAMTGGLPVPGIQFVQTFDQMNDRLEKYLPVDIHPTVQGYRVLADAFCEAIWEDLSPS